MKKFLAFAIVLIMAGAGMTMYLPQFKIEQSGKAELAKYQIDQDSLKAPYNMDDMLLAVFHDDKTQYGLQLGLFSGLQQAIERAKKYTLDATPTIIQAVDTSRTWYVLVLGPYPSQNEGSKMQSQLLDKNSVQSKVIQWPQASAPDAETK